MNHRFDKIAFNSTAKKTPTESDKEHYIGLEHIDSECLEITRWGSNVAPIGEKLIMKKGDVLFGKRRAYQRKLAIAPFDGIFSAHGMVLRPNEEVVDKKYFPFFMSSDLFMERAVQISVGGLSPTINWKDLREQEFPLPSLAEQKVLADKLWAAYRLKESYKKLLAATEEMVKSQFIEMFGCLAERVALSSLCDTFIDGDWIEAKDQSGSGIRLIQTGNVGVGTFKDKGDRARYISEETFNRLNCTEVVEGDILISRLPEPVGRACIIPAGLGKSITAVDCTIIRLNDKVLPKFFVAFTNTPDYAMQIKKVLSGTTRLRVSRANLGKIQVPLPSIDKQQQFVTIAEQADKSGFVGFKSQFIEMFGIAEATKPLADFVEVSFPGEWGQEDKDGSGVKVIRTTNFTNNGKLDLSEVVTRDIDSAKIEKKKLFKGDIILERSGGTNDNPVGRVVYFEEDGVYLFNNFTQLLRCKEGVNSLFIFYSLFNYYQMNKNVIRSMGNKTTGIQNLKMDRYWQIPIADVSIELQKEFESIYRQADKSGFRTQQIH